MLDKYEFSLFLIRHGESEVNVQPDLMGQTSDIKLTEKGRNQAKLLNKKLFYSKDGTTKWHYSFAFSSPYVRALDTAMITLGTNNITLAPELREYDAGDWTGCSRSETITDSIKMKMGYLNMAFRPPKGESNNMVERRASQWIEDNILYNQSMINSYNKYGEPLNFMVFSHGMTIKTILHYIMGFDKSFLWKIDIDNTSVTKLSFDRTGWRLNYINDCSHLY